MKRRIWMCVFAIACIACTQTKQNPGNEETGLRVTQLEAKMVEMERRMARIEEISRELLSRQQETDKKQAVTADEPLPELPVVAVKHEPWSEKAKENAQKFIDRFENSDEKKEPSSCVGRKFPLLKFVDTEGSIVDLEQYRGKKVLLIVLRGFAGGVCLICSSQTVALYRSIEEFRKRNVEVVICYPGKPETVPAFLSAVEDLDETFRPPFPVVLDPELALVEEFDLHANLAKPSSFVLDEGGVIRYCYIGKNAADRPSIPSLLEVFDNMRDS